jgi:hypothetical protein
MTLRLAVDGPDVRRRCDAPRRRLNTGVGRMNGAENASTRAVSWEYRIWNAATPRGSATIDWSGPTSRGMKNVPLVTDARATTTAAMDANAE